MINDEQLVAQALTGSEAAFTELVGRYQERLLRFLLTRCRSRADAEDALQDTFMNAYRYLPSFDVKRRFSTWLYRIAIRNAVRPALAPAAGDAQAVSPDDPLAACIVAGERENLWQTAGKVLSADACTAMWLHYVEDMPLREIARVMDKSLPWTKVTLLRARRRLQAAMVTAQNDNGSEAYG